VKTTGHGAKGHKPEKKTERVRGPKLPPPGCRLPGTSRRRGERRDKKRGHNLQETSQTGLGSRKNGQKNPRKGIKNDTSNERGGDKRSVKEERKGGGRRGFDRLRTHELTVPRKVNGKEGTNASGGGKKSERGSGRVENKGGQPRQSPC